MTTTETTTPPVVDRLFALITHLAKANRSDLAEHIANIRPSRTGLEIQFASIGEGRPHMIQMAATFDHPEVTARFFPADEHIPDEYHLHINGLIASGPIHVWCGVPAVEGDTEESVVAAAQDDLAALLGYPAMCSCGKTSRNFDDAAQAADWLSNHTCASREG